MPGGCCRSSQTRAVCASKDSLREAAEAAAQHPWRRERSGGGLARPLSNVLPAMATSAFTPHGSGYSTPTGTTGSMNTPLLAGRVLASRRVVIERHFGGRRYRGLHWCAGVAAGQRLGRFIARGREVWAAWRHALAAAPPAVARAGSCTGCVHSCLPLMLVPPLCNSLCVWAVLSCIGCCIF